MSLPPAELQYQEEHIRENSAPAAIAVISVFGAIALACLIARIVVRVRGIGLGLDDYLMVAGGLCTFVNVLTVYELSHWGIGKHLIAVPPENFVPLGKWTVVSYFSFSPAIAFVKWSILALIARTFTMFDPIIKWGVWIISIYTFLWLLGLYIANGLGCQPFDSYWSLTTPCELPWVDTETATILDIISDLAIVLLPQHIIWNLQMSTRKKLAVTFLLGLGLFCTATGIVRICVTKGTNKFDETYQTVPLIFTCLEPLVGIIAGCLPILQSSIFRIVVAARDGLTVLSNISLSRFSVIVRTGSRSTSHASGGKSKTSEKLASTELSENSTSRQPSAADVESQTHANSNTDTNQIHRKTEVSVVRELNPSGSEELRAKNVANFP